MALDIKNDHEIDLNGERLIVCGVEHWSIAPAAGIAAEMTQTVSIYAPPPISNGKRGAATLQQSNVRATPFLPLAAGEVQLRTDLKTPHLAGQMFLDGTDEVVRLVVERINVYG